MKPGNKTLLHVSFIKLNLMSVECSNDQKILAKESLLEDSLSNGHALEHVLHTFVLYSRTLTNNRIIINHNNLYQM